MIAIRIVITVIRIVVRVTMNSDYDSRVILTVMTSHNDNNVQVIVFMGFRGSQGFRA